MCGQKEAVKFDLFCADCISESASDMLKIEGLIREGHTRHCACRLTWGDGECECGKQGRTREEQIDGLIEAVKGELR
jgi:hypothetical protein